MTRKKAAVKLNVWLKTVNHEIRQRERVDREDRALSEAMWQKAFQSIRNSIEV